MINGTHLKTAEESYETMIGIIYTRVSTRQQEKEGTSLDTQVEKCLKLADERGIYVPKENILREQGSGIDPLRPYFLAFNEAIENRRVNAAVLYDADRYAREPLFGQVPGCGVRVRHPDCTAQAAADCVSGASCSASCFVVTPGVR